MSAYRNTTALLDNQAIAVKHLLEMLESYHDDDLVQDSIAGQTDFFECVDTILEAIAEDEALMVGAEVLAKKFSLRVSSAKKRNEWRKRSIEAAFLAAGIKNTIKRPSATLSIKRNPPTLGPVDEADLPSQFFTPQPPKLDRKGLLAALKDGETIPGANLASQSYSLQIRRA